MFTFFLCTLPGQRPFTAEGSGRARPGRVLVLFVHFSCCTYKVRNIKCHILVTNCHYSLYTTRYYKSRYIWSGCNPHLGCITQEPLFYILTATQILDKIQKYRMPCCSTRASPVGLHHYILGFSSKP